MILKNIKLNKALNDLLKKHDDVIDVLVFGSAAREKYKPTDIDILVLFYEKVNVKTASSIRKKIEEFYTNVSLVSKTEKTVLDPSFDARESILFEAKSLITGNNLAERYGFTSFGMFKYNFGDWNGLMKTKFYHAFNGRRGYKGVCDMLECIKLSDGVVLVPLKHIDEFKDFLENWKLKYIYSPMLTPTRMGKKKIIEM